MRAALRVAVATALAVPLTLVVAPAAQAGICVTENTFNYSPPLGLTSLSGGMSGSHDNGPCLFGGAGSGGIATTYTGNCIVAIFGANTASVVVLGGTVHVMVDALALKTKVLAMVPDGVCPTSSATGSGVYIDA